MISNLINQRHLFGEIIKSLDFEKDFIKSIDFTGFTNEKTEEDTFFMIITSFKYDDVIILENNDTSILRIYFIPNFINTIKNMDVEKLTPELIHSLPNSKILKDYLWTERTFLDEEIIIKDTTKIIKDNIFHKIF